MVGNGECSIAKAASLMAKQDPAAGQETADQSSLMPNGVEVPGITDQVVLSKCSSSVLLSNATLATQSSLSRMRDPGESNAWLDAGRTSGPQDPAA